MRIRLNDRLVNFDRFSVGRFSFVVATLSQVPLAHFEIGMGDLSLRCRVAAFLFDDLPVVGDLFFERGEKSLAAYIRCFLSFQPDVHHPPTAAGDRHQFLLDRSAVLDCLELILPRPQNEFLNAGSRDAELFAVERDFDGRVVDFDHQRAFARGDADHGVRQVGDPGGLGDAEATDHGQQHDGGQQPRAAARASVTAGLRCSGSGKGLRVGVLDMCQVAAQQIGHLGGRLEPLLPVFCQQPVDDCDQPIGDFRVDRADGTRRVVTDSPHYGQGALGAKRGPSSTHRVEHASQTEQVGPRINRQALGLFGRHVLRRAGHVAGPRHAHVVGSASQTEVGDLDPLDAVFQEDVRRLDVAMDDTLLVGSGQPGGDLQTNPQSLLQAELPLAVDLLLQRLAIDEFHHQVGWSTLLDGIDGHYVIMTYRGHGPRLPQKTLLGRRVRGQLRREQLDGHDAVELGVDALQDDAHPPPADNLGDLILCQPAQGACFVGRVEKIQRHVAGRLLRLGLILPGRSLQAVDYLQQGRFRRASRLGEMIRNPVGSFSVAHQSLQLILAKLTRFDVLSEHGVLLVGKHTMDQVS